MDKVKADGHKKCDSCRHPPHAAAASTAPPACNHSPPPTLFDHDSSTHSHLSIEQKWSIITLHKDGRDNEYISQHIPFDARSVHHWLDHYQQHHTVDDQHRSGRKRKTTTEIEEKIEQEAKETKFTTPRSIKRKLGIDVSSLTIDRRLIEVGLFGRVARHKKKLNEEEKCKRLSFAQGYKNWTIEQWMHTMFADEKICWGEVFSGQVCMGFLTSLRGTEPRV